MKITTVKCPHCGYVLDQYRGMKETVGAPTKNCPSCNNHYSTGMQYWCHLNNEEKVLYILKNIFAVPISSIIYTGFIIVPIILLLVFAFKIDIELFYENHKNISLIILSIVYLGIIVLHVWYLMKKIREKPE